MSGGLGIGEPDRRHEVRRAAPAYGGIGGWGGGCSWGSAAELALVVRIRESW